MELNKYGAFVVGRNKVRLIPYRHHLYESAWMVTIITGQIEPSYHYFAVGGERDGKRAAENAYGCYLKERAEALRLKDAPMRELDETKMKKPRKYTHYIDIREA